MNILIQLLHRCDSAVLSGVTLMLFACIVWLKLVSYAHTNYDLRVLAKSQEKVMRENIYLILVILSQIFPLKFFGIIILAFCTKQVNIRIVLNKHGHYLLSMMKSCLDIFS